MNWDDLRVALAVHKCGSFSRAGAQLGVDETTVARRLSRLQQDLGFVLFGAVDGERRPTPQCKTVLAQAEQIARHIDQIADLGETGKVPVGQCRVAATDSVAAGLLAPRAAAFLKDNPGLTLRILTSTENVNFSRWEADLAVRLQKPAKGDFVISKLADMKLMFVEPADQHAAGGDGIVCAFPEDLDETPEFRFLASAGLTPLARFVTKNLLVIQPMLRSGLCSGILPEYMCSEFLADGRFKVTSLEQSRDVWLLVQPHLKDDRATRIVIDWVKDCFSVLER